MTSTPTRDLPEEFLAATRKSQEAMIRAIKTWVETVRTVTPKLPPAYAERLPSLPSVTVPFADKLPKPEDIVASGYDFAEHLLAIQRKFAEDLLQATEPLIPANARRAWQDATKADAAAAAKKTAAAAKTAVTETVQATGKAIADATPKPATPKPATPTAEVAPSEPKAVATTAPEAPAQTAPGTPAAAVRKAPAAKPAPKPAAARPAATKPAATKPAATKPAATKPAATKPAPKATPAAGPTPQATPAAGASKPAAPESAPKPAAAESTAARPAAAPRAPRSTGTS
jgi:hypothetical protein